MPVEVKIENISAKLYLSTPRNNILLPGLLSLRQADSELFEGVKVKTNLYTKRRTLTVLNIATRQIYSADIAIMMSQK